MYAHLSVSPEELRFRSCGRNGLAACVLNSSWITFPHTVQTQWVFRPNLHIGILRGGFGVLNSTKGKLSFFSSLFSAASVLKNAFLGYSLKWIMYEQGESKTFVVCLFSTSNFPRTVFFPSFFSTNVYVCVFSSEVPWLWKRWSSAAGNQ